MLVDNESSINITFRATFDKMEVDHELTLMSSPLYRFTGDCIILLTTFILLFDHFPTFQGGYFLSSKGKITLAIGMGTTPFTAHHFMKFFVVDNRFAYHGVLGRLALKEL